MESFGRVFDVWRRGVGRKTLTGQYFTRFKRRRVQEDGSGDLQFHSLRQTMNYRHQPEDSGIDFVSMVLNQI